MPVLAKQNISLDQQLYDYHFRRRAAEFAVYDSAFTASTSIQHRLLLLRNHHQKCASRRRHALANEMKQESQRADWLKRKYIDSVRQQQPSHQQQTPMSSSSRVPMACITSVASTAGGSGEGTRTCTSAAADTEHSVASEVSEVKPGPNGGSSSSTGTKLSILHPPGPGKEIDMAGTSASSGHGQTTVRIKREPDAQEYLQPSSSPPGVESRDIMDLHAPLQQVPDHTSLRQESVTKRRQSIKADHFKWINLSSGSSVMDQDARDDLKLTAYDVIAGVISTPPIKPLEPEAENATSKLKPLPGQSSVSPTSSSTTPHLASSSSPTSSTTQHLPNGSACSTSPVPKVSKEQHDLVHELDQFSKIMDEVTQQQTAMELAAAKTGYVEDSHKQLYPTASHALPRDAPSHNSSFYQHQLSHNPSSSQVADQDVAQPPHRCNMAVDSKPLLLTRGNIPGRLTLLKDVPSPLGNPAMPRTPSTPLEHFCSFPSPSPCRIMSSTAAHSGTTHHTPHHAHHPGTPHLPQHPSTPQLPPHPGTPHHPSTPHHPLHPSSTALPHPTTPYHPAQHVACSPYLATHPLPYRYEPAPEPGNLQCSMAGERWPMAAPPPHDQMATPLSAPLPHDQITTPMSTPFPHDQTPTSVSSQGTLRDSIMARVSSRVVALAGQKRPPRLDLSGAPPTKMKGNGGMLDCNANHGRPAPSLYSPITQHLPSPFQSGPLSGSSFPPRQQL